MGKSNNKNKGKVSKFLKLVVSIGVMFLLGFAGGYLAAKYSFTLFDNMTVTEAILLYVVMLLGVFVTIYAHIIIHEAGHLLFGLFSGYKFRSFRIMSFMFVKEDGRIHLKRYTLAGTGGQCLMSPPDLVDGKMPVILYNLGGSITNLIVSLLVLIIYIQLPTRNILILSTLLIIFIVIGFMVAITNGIPMRTMNIDNDGYNAWALTRNKEALRSFWTQLKVGDMNSMGVRLKNMPQEWFTKPKDEDMKNSMIAAVGVFSCNRLLDEQEFDKANEEMKHMLRIESGMVGIHRNLLLCDRIYCELLKGNKEDALSMHTKELKMFMKSMKKFPSVIRTEYAIELLAHSNIEKADIWKKQFDKVALTYPYKNDIESEGELMEVAKHIGNVMEKEILEVM